MKLIVIHGNGLSAISRKISLIKKDYGELSTQVLSGKENSFKSALVGFLTPQLFSEKRLVVLEDFDPSPGGAGLDLEKLDIEDENLSVVLKFSKSLPVASVVIKFAQSRKAQIFNFTEKDETSVFPFLDNLAEKKKGAFLELNKLHKEYGGQYLLTMIFYLFRRLITKPKKVPDFVARKMEMQRKNFSMEDIRSLYKFALETDFKIKSGLLEEKLGLTLLVKKIVTN